ncbi:OLC1v1015066C1 [Oldenlandia corymbosa var. corymbosa]|uniref:OLC1v1015066C1 n=1 Tax=Oldenlandia corymbosa var. corymbosa TaxID=529605 RepID=A0AAV1E609_OLDCO|nr:OLC1v1015066C1 [Oldenlandia corymbosa var. corymbosa]
MGSSGKWIKSLIPLKKSQPCDHEKGSGKSRKWKLWRTSSGGLSMMSSKGLKKSGRTAESECSESSYGGAFEGPMAAAVAAVVRAPHKDFALLRREWAATRIQTVFRAFLAKRAFRALKAVVRLQAIFRGRRVRKQAAVTLRCMQALVRVQARVRANSVQASQDSQTLNGGYNGKTDPIKEAENGWCDSRGTVHEVRSKLQMKQEGAAKRERAIAYADAQQQLRRKAMPNKGNANKRNPELSWLDSWMATKPWESRLMEEFQTSSLDMTPTSSKYERDSITGGSLSNSSEHGSVQVRRNNISTRVSARPSTTGRLARASSDPISDSLYDESTSTSSLSTSETQDSNKTPVEGYRAKKPSFMKATESIKAKQRVPASPFHQSHSTQWRSVDSPQFLQKPSSFSGSLNRRSADTDLYSVHLCKDLYPPTHLDKQSSS